MNRHTGYQLAVLRSIFEDIVGVEHVHAEEERRASASVDQYWLTHMWRAKGQEVPEPMFIVRPRSTLEVSRILRVCTAYKIPVTPRGGGSGTQGGAATPYGGVVLDMTRMDEVYEIDEISLVLDAQPGINGRVLENLLNERELMLAHYPSSVDISTLGGYLAARGSGVMSTKYGKAEDMVLSIEFVLPNGDIVDTLSYPNHANGPGLLQLFVGSEGTLGVITRVRMRLDPIPVSRQFQMIAFPTVADGLEAGRRVMVRRLHPAVMRLYDEAATVRSLQSTGHQVSGVNLVVMTDGEEDLASAEMRHIERIVQDCDGEIVGEQEGAHWWEHRYDFYKPPLQPGYPQLYGTVETVTDYQSILPLYEAKKAMLHQKYASWAPAYTAHFSHWYPWGTMIYDRFYIDSPPEDADDILRLHNQIWADCSRLNLEHRGMLNEHHGIGLKLGWLMQEQSPAGHRVVQQIKDLLDPAGVMNPGKLGLGL